MPRTLRSHLLLALCSVTLATACTPGADADAGSLADSGALGLDAGAGDGGGDAGALPADAGTVDAGTVDAGAVDAGQPRDAGDVPTVFVHGYLGRGSDWDAMRAGLAQRGFQANRLFAIDIRDTNQSMVAQANLLATFVDMVRTQTGATRVNLVGHSLGAPVARLHVRSTMGASAAHVISVAGANHGNDSACLTTLLGASSRQLCPAYASQQQSQDGVQFSLNGDPTVADVDETPFGVEEGGPLRWKALALATDLVISPASSECLDQASRGDCAAPVNVVLTGAGLDHAGMIRDARVIDLVAQHLRD